MIEKEIRNELPNNWIYVSWDDILNIVNGKHYQDVLNENGKYPIYGSAGIINYSDKYLCNEDTVIIVRKGTINSPLFVKEKFWNIDTAFGIEANRKVLIPMYLYYYCLLFDFGKLNQSTTIPSLTKANLLKINMPVTSLNEQKRIVIKIEKLFSNLDNSDKYLAHLEKQLKRYRQSVLKSAFEGELTREWREKQTSLESAEKLIKKIIKAREDSYIKDINEWKKKSLGVKLKKPQPYKPLIEQVNKTKQIATKLPNKWEYFQLGITYEVYIGATPSRKKASYWNGEINWVSSGEVIFKNISSTNEKITQDGFDNTSTKIHPIGTVLLAMIGEGKTRGQAGILKIEACHNQNTAALRVNNDYLSSKLLYYFFLFSYQQTRGIGSGNNQKALNKSKVSDMLMPLMCLEEQIEIVKQIEKHFSIIDKLEVTVQKSIKESKRLRQSILKQAFEGKLVDQDPNDESASELLKKIAKAKEAYKQAQKEQKKRKK